MSKVYSQDELNSYLDSAVLLRSHIDAGSYKQYIFPLLFFKRISDVYDEECEKSGKCILMMKMLLDGKKIIDLICLKDSIGLILEINLKILEKRS